MNKAILVIDMPSMCWECPLCHNDNVCDVIGDVTDDDSVDVRCPLKPMGLKTKTDGYVLYSTEYLKKHFETEYILWKELTEDKENNKYKKQIDEILGKDIVDKFFGGEE